MGLKVGDKVRILDVDAILFAEKYWKNGDVTEVVYIKGNGNPHLRTGNDVQVDLVITKDELHAIERIDDDKKPSKKQRIEALEREVAALKAEMEALRGAKKKADENPKTANQSRAEIIADAKSFVKEHTDKKGRAYLSVPDSRPDSHDWNVGEIKFNINAEKRTVVALAIFMASGRVREKAIAKCAPDDVFNADIGKAIAVGRLFGIYVERFVNAPKPDKFVVGHVVQIAHTLDADCIYGVGKITDVTFSSSRYYYDSTTFKSDTYSPDFSSPIGTPLGSKIIDDTEAQYEQ